MNNHRRVQGRRVCRGLLAIVLYTVAACAPAMPPAQTHTQVHTGHTGHTGHTSVSTRPAVFHPKPRPSATADRVFAPDQVAALGDEDVTRIYNLAREVPQVLDGLYCHCHCDRHSGHHSLLSCFESAHGSKCAVCLREAEIAHKLHQEGKSLDEIRAEIDRAFGSQP